MQIGGLPPVQNITGYNGATARAATCDPPLDWSTLHWLHCVGNRLLPVGAGTERAILHSRMPPSPSNTTGPRHGHPLAPQLHCKQEGAQGTDPSFLRGDLRRVNRRRAFAGEVTSMLGVVEIPRHQTFDLRRLLMFLQERCKSSDEESFASTTFCITTFAKVRALARMNFSNDDGDSSSTRGLAHSAAAATAREPRSG